MGSNKIKVRDKNKIRDKFRVLNWYFSLFVIWYWDYLKLKLKEKRKERKKTEDGVCVIVLYDWRVYKRMTRRPLLRPTPFQQLRPLTIRPLGVPESPRRLAGDWALNAAYFGLLLLRGIYSKVIAICDFVSD